MVQVSVSLMPHLCGMQDKMNFYMCIHVHTLLLLIIITSYPACVQIRCYYYY